MNTPEPEPRGGHKIRSPKTKITFLDRSGDPIVGEILEHKPLTIKTDSKGTVEIEHLNGSPLRFGTEDVRNLVTKGVHTVLQRDGWTSRFNLKDVKSIN